MNYLKKIKEFTSPDFNFALVGLTASEGIFSLFTELNNPDAVLIPDSMFYEFLPLDANGDYSKIVTMDKLEEGKEYEEICEAIAEYQKSTYLVFMLKSLKNFANNGRVSPVVAKIVGLAGICIVGKASEQGTLEPMHKCRGEKRSLEVLVNDLETEGFSSGKISIGHCENESAAERLKELILEKFKNVQIEIHRLKGLCSFYAEKGGILVGFERM